MMKLIADCGSTKIDWCLLSGDGEILRRFETLGMNAVMLSQEEMTQRFGRELMPELDGISYEEIEVFFYGAGCISPAVCANVADALIANLPYAKVEVATDLLGAARALCGHKPGVACIMGTGSNSCYFDGEKIAINVSPLGYILGDEGSGAVLGKILVGNVLKKQLPADLCEKFLKQYDLDATKIIQRVYREPGGNRFLASLSPFIKENIGRSEIRWMAVEAFKAFFVRNLNAYLRHSAPVANFIGSIAFYYSDLLSEAAAQCGWEIGKILKSPMEGLIQWHS